MKKCDPLPSSSWYHCYPCDVSYRLTDNYNDIRFHYSPPDGSFYHLHLDMDYKQTRLLKIGALNDRLILTLDFVMSGVTPKNVSDKIKTLLVFS